MKLKKRLRRVALLLFVMLLSCVAFSFVASAKTEYVASVGTTNFYHFINGGSYITNLTPTSVRPGFIGARSASVSVFSNNVLQSSNYVGFVMNLGVLDLPSDTSILHLIFMYVLSVLLLIMVRLTFLFIIVPSRILPKFL